MEAAMPLSLDARAYDWKVESPSPFMVEGENIVFSVGDFAPYQVKHVKVYFEGVGAKAERAVTSDLDAYPLTANPSPELLALSASFAGLSHQEKIRAIYQWMVENIAFIGINRQVEGANFALTSKSGDCTEHMLLAGELLARNGVSVRRVLGFLLPGGNGQLTANDLHNWLEVYDGKRWRVMDSSYNFYDDANSVGRYLGLHYYVSEQDLHYKLFMSGEDRLRIFMD